jgi:hypothetical protein
VPWNALLEHKPGREDSSTASKTLESRDRQQLVEIIDG